MTAPRIVLELGSTTTRDRCGDCPFRRLVRLPDTVRKSGARSRLICAIGSLPLETLEVSPGHLDTKRLSECIDHEERPA